MRTALIAAAVIAATLAFAAPPAGADDTSTTNCDRLVWSGSDGSVDQIWAADGDGKNRFDITSAGIDPDPTDNAQPQWSPDGTRVAWSGSDGVTQQIWVADADGGNRTQISTIGADPDPTENLEPQWSPSGAHVVWSGLDGAERQIYVAEADGQGRSEISTVGADPDPIENSEPQWSPNGTHVAWAGSDGATGQIYVADADGQNRAEISSAHDPDPDPTDNGYPQWSPDGTKIAWNGDVGTQEIFVAGVDGLGRFPISTVTTPATTANNSAEWSPDGMQLAWVGTSGATQNIYVADADGQNRASVSDEDPDPDPTANDGAQWSPDGMHIAWSGVDDMSATQIWVARADGTNRAPVSDVGPDPDPTDNVGPQWRPMVPTAFTDIANSFARDDIACIEALGITNGRTATTYDPGPGVTRQEMAAFIARLWRNLGNTCDNAPSPFTDISTSFAEDDINCLYNANITTGQTPTTYEPEAGVSREQMAAFMARMWVENGGTCDDTPPPFTDISTSFAKDDIACLYNLGITTGVTPTTYEPGVGISREQMAAFLNRLQLAARS